MYDPTAYDLLAYAKEYRYRTRNLHDGCPCPPFKRDEKITIYTGREDRFDAVIGKRGYVCQENDCLGFVVSYKTNQRINRVSKSITDAGGEITQTGDTELGGTIPISGLDAILKIIQVYRVSPGPSNPHWLRKAQTQDPC